jgi:nitroreductase
LTTTRAVRKRLDFDRGVPDAVLTSCIEVAAQAPTGANRQRWRWIVVRDEATRAALAAIYRKGYSDYITPQLPTLDLSDPRSARIHESAQFLAANLDRAPVIVVPCLLHRLAPDAPAEEQAASFGEILPAVWSFQLALRSRGIGSAWTTLHLRYEDEAAALLGIPPTVTQVAMLPVAYYRGDTFHRAPRRPVGEVVYRDRWKQLQETSS